MSKYVKFGQVLKSKKGTDYIKINDYDKVVIMVDGKRVNGASIFFSDPVENIKSLQEKGFITEAEAEQRIEKLPDFVLEDLTLVIDED